MPEMVSADASLKPPRVSMARGMKDMPAAWQAGPWVANFRVSATSSGSEDISGAAGVIFYVNLKYKLLDECSTLMARQEPSRFVSQRS